ncbi:DUF4386 family protein [Yeosuana sp. MJ-SS3]|uniref:DUF4386 family protein n=1 Tax=Gilvirhabdus luticola TaxID=3079858 RepID=A0ABU3U758_9FLAO|nr:DUF4386 family protein [Yeosuana sp. MJ-SS3]MDU8886243.1 DUF4386 family protein [Yeosuana sp. MJ-SS3]
MISNTFKRIVGFSSIGSALLFVVSIVGMQFYISGNLEDVSSFIQNMLNNNGMMLLYGWPGLTATMLMIPLFYYVHKINEKNKSLSKSFLIMSLIGVVFVLIAYLFHLAFTYFHAPIYQQLGPNEQLAFNGVFKSMVGIQDMFWLGGDIFAFLGIAFLAILSLKERILPKWMIIWVAIAGISAAVGSFNFLPVYKPNPVLEAMFMGGFLLFTLWEIMIGILLIRNKIGS